MPPAQESSSAPPPMPPGPEPISSTEIVKQLHETGRHSFDLYVRWFTFFVTINFVALGWLPEHKANEQKNLTLFSVYFSMIIFTILGIFSAASVRKHLEKLRDEIIDRVNPLANGERYVNASFPCEAYVNNLRLMIFALFVLISVWVFLFGAAVYGDHPLARGYHQCSCSKGPAVAGVSKTIDCVTPRK